MSNVSVIIPTYYRIDDLSELFKSILNQTVKPLEVLVVDDTPDETVSDLCKGYQVNFENIGIRLFYIKNKMERAITISRNLGVKHASEDFIMFLDSDLTIFPDYTRKIVEVFETYPSALGVQGWIVNTRRRRHEHVSQFLDRIFLIHHLTKDSCKFLEYPTALTKIINCEMLSGANMAYRREVFAEFNFDENLKKYCFMEDVLFSHSIFKKYPRGLFITPFAMCVHNASREGRVEGGELNKLENKHRKYVLVKLFGFRGVLLYYWQRLGISIKTSGKMFMRRARD